VVLACLYILVVQLIIYDFSNHMILMMPLIGLGLAFSARLHVMVKGGAGVGFNLLPTIGNVSIHRLHGVRDLVFASCWADLSCQPRWRLRLTRATVGHFVCPEACATATRFVG
jgi:hypothetical protein